jgi:vacuole morphology and inheritance protein 14
LILVFTHPSAELEFTVNFLVQIDNLVQMLESPIFVDLRLRLLEPHKYPYLLKTLYGILMLLPQSPAYDKLNKRLECVHTLSLLHMMRKGGEDSATEKEDEEEFSDLLQHFSTIQNSHKKTNNLDL